MEGKAIEITQSQAEIMKYFVRSLMPFKKGDTWSGVEMHRMFILFITTHPVDKMVKFISFFPEGYVRSEGAQGHKRTKALLKRFLDQTFKINWNTKRYWIKSDEDAERLKSMFGAGAGSGTGAGKTLVLMRKKG